MDNVSPLQRGFVLWIFLFKTCIFNGYFLSYEIVLGFIFMEDNELSLKYESHFFHISKVIFKLILFVLQIILFYYDILMSFIQITCVSLFPIDKGWG